MARANVPTTKPRAKAPSAKNVDTVERVAYRRIDGKLKRVDPDAPTPQTPRGATKADATPPPKHVNLAALLSKQATFTNFDIWIVGDTPLITHAWSEKAKRDMLAKQVKAPKAGREQRDPQADFVNSLYEMGEINGKKSYGFPSTGVKNAILSSAHKDKGIARSNVMNALWINAEMVRTRPALAGAICDMPLIRIWGDDPQNREDMVRIGSGLNKTATLAYRGQFTVWAMRVTGKFNTTVLSPDSLAFLVQEAGMASGLGEWRNERKGMFGAFHVATTEEAAEWEAFAAGEGPLPVPEAYKQAAE